MNSSSGEEGIVDIERVIMEDDLARAQRDLRAYRHLVVMIRAMLLGLAEIYRVHPRRRYGFVINDIRRLLAVIDANDPDNRKTT